MKKLICFVIIVSCLFSVVYADVLVPSVWDPVYDAFKDYPVLPIFLIIVVILISCFIGIKIWHNKKSNKGNKVGLTILLGAVLIFVIALIGIGMYNSMYEPAPYINYGAIVAMNNQIIIKYGASGKVISRKQARLLAEDVARANNLEKLFVTVMLDGTILFDNNVDDLNDVLELIYYERFVEKSYRMEYEKDEDGLIKLLKFTSIPAEEVVENNVDITVNEESLQSE